LGGHNAPRGDTSSAGPSGLTSYDETLATAADEATVIAWKGRLAQWREARNEMFRALDELGLTSFGMVTFSPPKQRALDHAIEQLRVILRGVRTPETVARITSILHTDVMPLSRVFHTARRKAVFIALFQPELFALPPRVPIEAVRRLLTHRSERVRLRLLKRTASPQSPSLCEWWYQMLGRVAPRDSMITISPTGGRTVRRVPHFVEDGGFGAPPAVQDLVWLLGESDETANYIEMLQAWSESLGIWRDEMRFNAVEWNPLMNRLSEMVWSDTETRFRDMTETGRAIESGWFGQVPNPVLVAHRGKAAVSKISADERPTNQPQNDPHKDAHQVGALGEETETTETLEIDSPERGAFPINFSLSAQWLRTHPLKASEVSHHLRQSAVWRQLVWRHSPSMADPEVLLEQVRTMSEDELRALFENPALTLTSIDLVRNWALFDIIQPTTRSAARKLERDATRVLRLSTVRHGSVGRSRGATSRQSSGSPVANVTDSTDGTQIVIRYGVERVAVRVLNALSAAGHPLSVGDIERLRHSLNFSTAVTLQERMCCLKDIMGQAWAPPRLLYSARATLISLDLVRRVVSAAPFVSAEVWIQQVARLLAYKGSGARPYDDSLLDESIRAALVRMLSEVETSVAQQINRSAWKNLLTHEDKAVREATVRRLGALGQNRTSAEE